MLKKNVDGKYSQGGYILFFCYQAAGEESTLGGRVQLVEYSSKKSTRVAKSSWAAELR